MNDQFYELTIEKNHLSIIIKALSNFICSQYDMLDAEVVDVPKTMENIKIASDMQLVLKHHLGGVQHSPKQTAETTGLVWIKEINLDEQEKMFYKHNDDNSQINVCYDECSELTTEQVHYLMSRLERSVNDENLQYTNEVLQQAWDNVKERNKDILQRMSDN